MNQLIKKSLLFLLFFILFFTIVNLIYLILLIHIDEGFKKNLQATKFENPDYELLVLGTSFAEYGVDTELLTMNGIKSFNLALAGNSYESSYIQLNEYLGKCDKRPSYALLFINSFRESGDDDIIEPIVEVMMTNYKFSLKDIPILRFTWLGTEMIKKIFSSKHRKAILSYGQVKFEKSTPDNTSFAKLFLITKDTESKHWVGEIAKLCYSNEVRFIIIEIPGFKETQNLSGFGPYELKLWNGYSVPLYNFNNQRFCEIFDSQKDWIGNSHLNSRGATKFTKELIPILQFDNSNGE